MENYQSRGKLYMVTEAELKKYSVFDKIEKKELTHYLLLDDALEFFKKKKGQKTDFTEKEIDEYRQALDKYSEYFYTGGLEEDWYYFVFSELNDRK